VEGLIVELFDRSELSFFPLAERKNKVRITGSCVDPNADPGPISDALRERVNLIAREIVMAKNTGKAVIIAFGAHAIKNGLGRLLAEYARNGWVTHLATNGAGVIHDWEFAFQGQSSEDVRANVQIGRFGTWEETGLYINLGLAVGAYEGLGYGESIGALICQNGLDIPDRDFLRSISAGLGNEALWKQAAACDLLELVETLRIPSGRYEIQHLFPEYSVQAETRRLGLPFTSHPMFGHDIIYTHVANRGAVVGRTAERDFLAFVRSVSLLQGGVYLSVGSAVMSPMIFEKSLSMARNVSRKIGADIGDCGIHVVDLQEETWDWSTGEPPMDNPAYYLRFMKTFNRMGCRVDYTSADNRAFFLALHRALADLEAAGGAR